ncbi:MAG TPA: aspartate--tRNA(Asn) ligase [Candidatus Dojkabacteria bacterium]|nr:aspartate--tRNA(Asn) ligase [Candidatus Dojkabacteria bacterium]
MERTYIKDLKEKIGKEVLLKGWIHTLRAQGSMVFIILRDVTGLIQCISLNKELSKQLDQMKPESVVEIEGFVKEEKQAPDGFEVELKAVKVLSEPADVLPIPIVEKAQNETKLSKRLNNRWLDLRKPENLLIFKVSTVVDSSFSQFFVEQGFIEIHSPKTLITSTESGSDLFEVNYFGKKAYLAQSPQLYKQMAMAAGFEKVFEIGPAFRAEPSFTSRHATEFTMFDVEMSFMDSVEQLMDVEEKMITRILSDVKSKYGDEIKSKYKVEINIPKEIPRFSFEEAKKILKDMGIENEKIDDLSSEDEKAFGEYVQKEKGSDLVFIYDYPATGRAFYSMRYEDRPEYTKSFDLLYKGLEITSGAIREHRYETLKENILKKGFKLEDFTDYINFFKYACPPHGGFAPGPARIIMQILELKNIRDAMYIFRGVKRITP